ncbi:MAG TPA: hypothetical protein VJ867_09415 [Gemmatimonadaceae bacterium]|nr:hypothetical protein [Gemmatimonadaceae bacterium]
MHQTRVTRREFSKSALGTVLAVGSISSVVDACASLPTAESMRPEPQPVDPSRRAQLSAADMATWRDIAHLARLAPTPHNTQPFRIRPLDATTAEIVALPERFLPEEDHGNRYVASAFGIMAATLEMAARSLGVEAHVTRAQSIDVPALHKATTPTVLGVATIAGATDVAADAALLDIRRTSRIPYHDQLVPEETWAALRAGTLAHGHRLLEYHDRHVVDATLQLNVDAIIDNLGLRREREEIRRWYRIGPTPEFGDGLWEKPLNQSSGEIGMAFGSPWFFRMPIVRPIAEHRYLKTQRGTRHIVLLCGAFETWPDLVEAGRALFGMWIGMAKAGVYIQPMGSMLTNAKYAAEIARRFGVTDCWLVMRAGYSDTPPRAPRLESILV